MQILKVALVLMFLGVCLCDENDIMRELPDCEPFHYNAYSGYLTINDEKALHYVFLNSQDDPIHDPLLLWFNGGPGCSSMLGFFQEHGPCIIDDNEKFVKQNPHPWNKRANIVYIEHPAGTGYSYCANKDTVEYDDMSQSEDLYAALVSFYEKFPSFKLHDLYITGESYAGIYVPYLAYQIHNHNALVATNPDEMYINLKGFAVGNGVTDFTVDMEPSFPDTYWQMGTIDRNLYDTMIDNGCLRYFRNVIEPVRTVECEEAWYQFEVITAQLNGYDLYRHTNDGALSLTEEERMEEIVVNGEMKSYKRGFTLQEYTPWYKGPVAQGEKKKVLGAYVTTYANREDVRTALHIRDDVGLFEQCWSGINYTELPEGSIWIYSELKGKYRILKYSGDTDGVVPTYGTRRWIQNLGWTVLEKWRAWYTNDQVSGYIERYNGLDFVTVHGVGHMCPQWKREDVTNMIMAWVHNEDF